MLVVVCVAIIVVGPKDLPKVLRGFGKAMKAVRGLAGDFQKQFEEAVKDAELDDVKNIATGKGFQPLEDVKKSVSNFEKDVKAQMEARAKEMDEAMEAEAAGLPEPVSTKADAAKGVTETAKTLAPTKAEAANGEVAATPKVAAKKPPAKKPATKKPDTGKTAAARSTRSGNAKKAEPKTAAKPTKTKPARKSAANSEKTA